MVQLEGDVQVGPSPAAEFAAHMLLAALQAPGSETPAAARTMAGLIGLLAAEGADSEVAFVLGPVPGGRATFHVVAESASDDPGGPPQHDPEDRPVMLVGLDVGRALREASRLAEAGPGRIRVTAVGANGLRRRVLERDPDEPFRFLFPTEGAFEGPADTRLEALRQWQNLAQFAAPAASVPSSPPPGATLAVPTEAVPALATVHSGKHVRRDDDAGDHDDAETVSPAELARIQGEALVDAVRDALADVTVEVDMAAVEQMVADALRSAIASAEASRPAFTEQRPTQAPESDASGGQVSQSALMGAADQFHIVLESFNDRIKAGSRSLQSLADELASRDRTAAAFTDQLAKSVNASIERLARHIDTRLDDLANTSRNPADRRPDPED